jgi:hypothetical protein
MSTIDLSSRAKDSHTQLDGAHGGGALARQDHGHDGGQAGAVSILRAAHDVPGLYSQKSSTLSLHRQGTRKLTFENFSQAERLLREMKGKDKPALKKMMGVSDAVADLNYKRFQAFDVQEQKQAALAFDGPAYKVCAP